MSRAGGHTGYPLRMHRIGGVLGIGIGNFGKGGRDSGRFSNKMMQWRIGLQFLAVILILIFVTLMQGA